MIKENFIKFTFISVLLSSPFSLSAQLEWEQKKYEDGVQVFTKDQKSTEFKAFKAISEFDCPPERLVEILRNVENYRKVFPNTIEARLLEKRSNGDFVHYSRKEAPWPVSDRDGTFTTHFSQEGNVSILRSECLSGIVDPFENVVRIESSLAIWRMEPLPNHRSKLVYEVYADPNGKLPAWLVNSAAISQPLETLINLRALLK